MLAKETAVRGWSYGQEQGTKNRWMRIVTTGLAEPPSPSKTIMKGRWQSRTAGVRANGLRGLVAVGLTALVPGLASGQNPVGESLSLEQALEVATRNNPGLQVIRNDMDVANWNVRSAYGQWIPSASASSGFSWQGPGEQQFGSLTAEQLGFADQPSFYFSNYSLGLNYTLDGRTIMAPGQAKRNRDATGAQISDAEATLRQNVTRAYLEALRQQEGLLLAQQQLERAQVNQRLAEGRREVGSGNAIDVQQAEVNVGRAQVEVLRSENNTRNSKIRLLQQLGVELTQTPELTTAFEIGPPVWNAADLYTRALERNPSLSALRASEEAARYGERIARSAYLPSLNFRAGMSGFSRQASSTASQEAQARAGGVAQQKQCESLNDLVSRLADPLPTQDCTRFLVGDETIQEIRDRNDRFPFDFTKQPASAGVTISIPIFQGLGRQRDVETARAQREDARHRVREQELALEANIASALGTVETAYQAALIEERNQTLANEQLRLAQDRYGLGLTSFIELVEAETVKAQADRERIAAIFAYHDALADLEAVVGTPLRNR